MKALDQFIRIQSLQIYCWTTNKKRWAKRLGQMLREFREDNPEFRHY